MSGNKFVARLALGVVASLVSLASIAGPVSGKKNLICDSAHVVACADGACMQGTPVTFGLMNFFFVDIAKREVHGVDSEGQEALSPVKNSEITEEAIILQGFENHRGWTMGIDRKTGGLTLSSTGADVNFMITGNCIER